jgi:3-phenylpropionate/trans-cinnamate dioxygenase ferredoxin subunit
MTAESEGNKVPHWIAVCATSDIDRDDLIPFTHAGVEYAVYRSASDEYFATAGRCTHEQTLLCEGLVMGGVIECPMHNGRFDYKTGRALGAPAIIDLRTYPTKVEAGTVYLDTDGG